MAAGATVTWLGLPDLLRQFDRAYRVTDTLYEQAGKSWGERVAGAVRGKQKSSRLSASVRSDANKKRVEVTLGRPGIPFTGWLEFGGPRISGSRRYRRIVSRRLYGGVTRAPYPYVSGGRSLYPTLARMRPEGLDAYGKKTREMLDDLAGGG